MTDVNGLDVLLAWVEFAVLAGGVLAVLLHRSGRHGDARRPNRDDDEKA